MVILVTGLFTYEVSGEDRGKPRIQKRLGASPGTRSLTKGRRRIWGGMKKGIKMYHRLHTHIIIYVAVPLLLAAVFACGAAATPTPEATHTPTLKVTPTTLAAPATVPTPTPSAVPAPSPNPTPTAVPTLTPTPDIISSLQDVRRATVQIEAQGSFVDSQFGERLNVIGRGSGVIIDEAGIAVTNNHVVTGAAILRVFVGGESRPRNARIVGVSECSDLAVIDIEGAGYPYLEWFDGQIYAGLDVFAAGFPLGDPEFTLTRGIVSKSRTRGETNWASVDAVIEHDATINPGNSGGPLVTTDGKVVGINYAGSRGTSQFFAISRDEALKVIDQLRTGQDINSIGVNGTAVRSEDGALSGVWVASVKSGSPASNVGIRGGDVITRLEGLVLATDGTMADYCDVLRTHLPGDVLSIEVLRFDTGEMLEGKLNDYRLKPVSKPTQTPEPLPTSTTDPSFPYTRVNDDTGLLTIEIPEEWGDADGRPFEQNGEVVGPAVAASINLAQFFGGFGTPGVLFIASQVWAEKFDQRGLLDKFSFNDGCTRKERSYTYADGLYTGTTDFYGDCQDGHVYFVLAATPEDSSFIILLLIGIESEADQSAIDRIVASFRVLGDLPR